MNIFILILLELLKLKLNIRLLMKMEIIGELYEVILIVEDIDAIFLILTAKLLMILSILLLSLVLLDFHIMGLNIIIQRRTDINNKFNKKIKIYG